MQVIKLKNRTFSKRLIFLVFYILQTLTLMLFIQDFAPLQGLVPKIYASTLLPSEITEVITRIDSSVEMPESDNPNTVSPPPLDPLPEITSGVSSQNIIAPEENTNENSDTLIDSSVEMPESDSPNPISPPSLDSSPEITSGVSSQNIILSEENPSENPDILIDSSVEMPESDSPNSISPPPLDPPLEITSDVSSQNIIIPDANPNNTTDTLIGSSEEMPESENPNTISLQQSYQLETLPFLEVGGVQVNTEIISQELATSVALGKPISSSNSFSNSGFITDGNKLDTAAFADSTPNQGLQWVQVDLQAVYDVNEIRLWHYYGDSRQYQDVIVQLSMDALFSECVITVFNNDRDNSAGMGIGTDSEYVETSDGKAIAVESVAARYVRFYANGNSVNGYSHYVEIEVYGTATSVALGKPISSSNSFSNSGSITDGNKLDTAAFADSIPNQGLQWVQVDLEAVYDFYEIRLWHYYGDPRQYQDVIVQLSMDILFSAGVTTVFNNDGDNSAGMGIGTDREYVETSDGKAIAVDSVAARYVRFYANGNSVDGYSHYIEIEIYGKLRPSSGTFLKIPTPYNDGTDWEGSTYQATHPSVVQFDVAWNGYKYWMAFTPYPYQDTSKENPSIVASNDGFSWVVPEGGNNPIVPYPSGIVSYNSDPSLFYNAETGELEMWYRQVQSVPNTSNEVEVIFRVKTTDAVNWTLPEEMIHSDNPNIHQYISPSIIYEDTIYKMWAMRDYKIFYAESTNGKYWSEPIYAKTNGADFNTWHPSVVKLNGTYYVLNNDLQGRIWYSTSTDEINYSSEKIILETDYPDGLYRATMATGTLGFYVYYGMFESTGRATIWMAYGSNLDIIGVKPQGGVL